MAKLTTVRQYDARNARKIEEDLDAVRDRLGISLAQCRIVRLRNPENRRVVVVIENHAKAGVYNVQKGTPQWLGHNGYQFSGLE